VRLSIWTALPSSKHELTWKASLFVRFFLNSEIKLIEISHKKKENESYLKIKKNFHNFEFLSIFLKSEFLKKIFFFNFKKIQKLLKYFFSLFQDFNYIDFSIYVHFSNFNFFD
jgi:hypothetical protein